MTNTVPILAIDVDGVLSPSAFTKLDKRLLRKQGFHNIEWRRSFVREGRWTPLYDLWLHPGHAKMLCEFSARHDVELMWCTLWGKNTVPIVGRAMGLPRLPFVDFHNHWSGSRSWKWEAAADAFAGRPVAWLDDSFGKSATKRRASGWAAARRGLPTLLVDVEPWSGLQRYHLDEVASWLRTVDLAW